MGDSFALDFILAGFGKCGSTTLWSMLREHPQIFMPGDTYDRKEPSYFSEKPDSAWPNYVSLFKDAPTEAVRGEASQNYSAPKYRKISRDRILGRFPEIKLIFIARDPLDRLESDYRELHHSGRRWQFQCPYSIDELLEIVSHRHRAGFYWPSLQCFRERVPDDRIHVVLFEDLMSRPEAVMAGLFAFLGVDETYAGSIAVPHLNPGTSKLQDTPRLRKISDMSLSPETAEPLRKLSPRVRDELLRKLKLRVPFSEDKVPWTLASQTALAEEIVEDCHSFLAHIGRDREVWPHLCDALDAKPPLEMADG